MGYSAMQQFILQSPHDPYPSNPLTLNGRRSTSVTIMLDAIETLQHLVLLLERSSDKLSCGHVIFKIFPFLGEFPHYFL
jgi:hypothetical protein